MTGDELRALQAPVKERYRLDPATAVQTLKARADLNQSKVTCVVRSPRGPIEAGLHPGTGGTGEFACSADMMLEALASCAGVTLAAVATAMGITIRSAALRTEGDLDFRGTLGVSKESPVGFKEIRLFIDIDTDATAEQIETLVKLTKRYCVVYQTMAAPPAITTTWARGTAS
jgi:uncharacterized OsmC-like protein